MTPAASERTQPAARGDGTPTSALTGKRVLVPRAVGQASALSTRIARLGGEPVEAPVLVIEPGDRVGLRAAVRELADGRFSVVCLTSANGVDAVADALAAEQLAPSVLGATSLLAVVGAGTAQRLAERLSLRADLVPPRATTRSLGEAIPAGAGRALLPRADIASPVLPRLLAEKGYDCVEVVAYRTGAPPALPERVLDALGSSRIDLVAVASSSTVRNFVALVGDHPWDSRVVSIGPVTTATCREYGIEVAAEADPHDLDGLVDALVRAAS